MKKSHDRRWSGTSSVESGWRALRSIARRSNAMNAEFLEALCRAVMACHGEPGSALSVERTGRNFCAGGDIHTFASKGERCRTMRGSRPPGCRTRDGIDAAGGARDRQRAGICRGGGGFGLVCAADLVIAADSARFLAGHAVGMAPDAGVSVTLPQLVGLRARPNSPDQPDPHGARGRELGSSIASSRRRARARLAGVGPGDRVRARWRLPRQTSAGERVAAASIPAFRRRRAPCPNFRERQTPARGLRR